MELRYRNLWILLTLLQLLRCGVVSSLRTRLTFSRKIDLFGLNGGASFGVDPAVQQRREDSDDEDDEEDQDNDLDDDDELEEEEDDEELEEEEEDEEEDKFDEDILEAAEMKATAVTYDDLEDEEEFTDALEGEEEEAETDEDFEEDDLEEEEEFEDALEDEEIGGREDDEELEPIVGQAATPEGQADFEEEVLVEDAINHSTDEDSSGNVDREELADAYDVGETLLESYRAGDTEGVGEDERVSIDDVPPPAENGVEAESMETDPEEPVRVEPAISTVEPVTSRGISAVNPPEPAPAPAVPTKIDDETFETLRKVCEFKRWEINAMKPEIAVIVAKKRLKRPLEGMPPNWYRKDVLNERKSIYYNIKMIGKALVPIALGSLAIYGGIELRSLGLFMQSNREASSPSLQAPVVEEEEEEPEPLLEVEEPVPEEEDTWLDKIIDSIARPIQAFLSKEI